MDSSQPKILIAGEREASVPCAKCREELQLGDAVAMCKDCGAVHHHQCWNQIEACSAYDCAGAAASMMAETDDVLTVTRAELVSAEPLRTTSTEASQRNAELKMTERRWNRTAIWAFALSLLGIPLFGIITGLIAILLACIAMVLHRENRRGMGLAVAALLIGLFDVVGWSWGLSKYFGTGASSVSLAEMAIDPSALEDLPDYIARAMRANVVIEVKAGFGRGGLGSGVVLQVKDNLAYIVTNRHVIDGDYSDSTKTPPKNLSDLADFMIMSVERVTMPGTVEWVAPQGIDLAIVSARFSKQEVQAAFWDLEEKTMIGEEVFAVGNPHGLGWTLTSGSVSQVRKRSRGGIAYRILQTSAPINPGNSGGGLYDAKGHLLGINTMTTEKRVAEGLGFSIDFNTLIELIPQRFNISNKNVEEDAQ